MVERSKLSRFWEDVQLSFTLAMVVVVAFWGIVWFFGALFSGNVAWMTLIPEWHDGAKLVFGVFMTLGSVLSFFIGSFIGSVAEDNYGKKDKKSQSGE